MRSVSKVWLTTLAFASTPVMAEDGVEFLKPTEAYIDAYKYKHMIDPYIAPRDEELKYGANFNLSFDIARYRDKAFYMKNILHFDQSERTGQIEHGGWQYEAGLQIYRDSKGAGIDLFQQHHSRHVMDEYREDHFPVYDRYGIRFNLITPGR